MTELIYDHTQLVEPNLLIPGKKPTGPVKVDNFSPYRDKLIHYYLFRTGQDEIGNNPWTEVGTVVPAMGGMDLSAGGISFGIEPGVESQTELSILIDLFLLPGALTEGSMQFITQKTTTVYGQWGSSSDIFVIKVASSSYVSSNACTAGPVTIVVTYNAGIVKMFQNGRLVDTVTDGDAITGVTGNTLRIGIDTDVLKIIAQSFGIWQRCLSDDLALGLSLDPYRFLVPKG